MMTHDPAMLQAAVEGAIGFADSVDWPEHNYWCPFCVKAGYSRQSHLHVNYQRNVALCLSGYQGVVTDRGCVPIYRVGAMLRRGEVVHALSLNSVTGREEWRRITRFYDNGVAAEFLHIVTDVQASSRGRGLVVTDNHPLYRLDGSEVPAGQVVPGDRLVGRYAQLSPDQEQLAIGTLLGDGHIEPRGRVLRVEHGSDQRYYALWKHAAFPGSSTPRMRHLVGGPWRERSSIQVDLSGYPVEFGRLREEFYPRGVKVVPQSVLDRLHDLGVAVWLMDDGSVRARQGRVTAMTLSCQGFDAASRGRVIDWFRARYSVSWLQDRGGRLRLTGSDARALCRVLRAFIVPDATLGSNPRYRSTKRFLCPPVSPGAVASGAVRVLSVRRVAAPQGSTSPRWRRYCVEVVGNHNFYTGSGLLVRNCHQCEYGQRNLSYLVLALTGRMPRTMSQALMGQDLEDAVRRILDSGAADEAAVEPPPSMPEGFVTLTRKPKDRLGRVVLDYLLGRGVPWERLAECGAGYVTEGSMRGYAIFPVTVGGRFVTYTSRNVVSVAGGKVKHGYGPGAKRALFNFDHLGGCRRVFLTEGPFDAWAMHRRLNPHHGAVALLGTRLHDAQARLLAELPVAEYVVMLDADAHEKSAKVAGQLAAIAGRAVSEIRLGGADPDELPETELLRLYRGRVVYDAFQSRMIDLLG